MRAYGEAEVRTHSFLTLALDERDWSAAHPGRLTARKARRYRNISGLQSLSGVFGQKKIIISPVQGIEPRFLCRPTRNLETSRVLTTLSRLLTLGDLYKSQPSSKYWILLRQIQ